jgi:acyl carrier protein
VPTPNEVDLLEMIRAQVQAVAPELDAAAITPDAYIADIGVDSIALMAMIGRLERRLGVSLPGHELARVESVGDLVRVAERALTGRFA